MAGSSRQAQPSSIRVRAVAIRLRGEGLFQYQAIRCPRVILKLVDERPNDEQAHARLRQRVEVGFGDGARIKTLSRVSHLHLDAPCEVVHDQRDLSLATIRVPVQNDIVECLSNGRDQLVRETRERIGVQVRGEASEFAHALDRARRKFAKGEVSGNCQKYLAHGTAVDPSPTLQTVVEVAALGSGTGRIAFRLLPPERSSQRYQTPPSPSA